MNFSGRVPAGYSRAEQRSDAAVHFMGVLFAVVAAPILILLSARWTGDRTTVAAAAVYGFCLFAMVCCSAAYHMSPRPGWKDTLRRIDQTAIYLMIAGSYTPFAVLTGSHAGAFLAGLWGSALLGSALILFSPRRLRWLSLALYLGMGWAGMWLGGTMLGALTPEAYALILSGGALYTTGVVFFLWERLPFHNTIWHLFVLAASAIVYAAVVIELWTRARP
jgi:hemolysin III